MSTLSARARGTLGSFFTRAPSSTSGNLQRPPSVQYLLEHSKHRNAETRGVTPIASLYRMYEFIVLGFTVGLRTEIEWFFNHASWKLSEIPDPDDPDPERYAILAVLPRFLVIAYNRLIEI